MKNIKTKFILSAIIFLSVAGFIGTVNAAGVSLYVSPATLTKTAGNTFSVSVGFNTSGVKVCAVEGTLVFNNLSCQSITVAGDVTPQSSPTCLNPHFLIGIPSCTTANKTLFTVSVKAGNAGTASINPVGVDIIGEGVSAGSASTNGNYTINAVPKPAPAPTPAPAPAPASTPASMPQETIILEVTTPETIPAAPLEKEEKKMITLVQPEKRQIEENTSLLAAIGSVVTFGTDNIWIGIFAGVIFFVIVIYVMYMFIHKKRKNPGKI